MADSEATPSNDVEISNTTETVITPYFFELRSVGKPIVLSDPAFSPDGENVIFVEHVRGTYTICTILRDGSDQEYIYSSDFPIIDPTYSADGFFVLFAEQVEAESVDATYGVWRLRYMKQDGTDVTTILDDGNANLHPSWITPTQIAFQWWYYGATPSSAWNVAMIDLIGQSRIEMGEGEYPRLVSI